MNRQPSVEYPNKQNHTPCPDGYLQLIEWTVRMAQTHKQVRCPTAGCG